LLPRALGFLTCILEPDNGQSGLQTPPKVQAQLPTSAISVTQAFLARRGGESRRPISPREATTLAGASLRRKQGTYRALIQIGESLRDRPPTPTRVDRACSNGSTVLPARSLHPSVVDTLFPDCSPDSTRPARCSRRTESLQKRRTFFRRRSHTVQLPGARNN